MGYKNRNRININFHKLRNLNYYVDVVIFFSKNNDLFCLKMFLEFKKFNFKSLRYKKFLQRLASVEIRTKLSKIRMEPKIKQTEFVIKEN